MTKPETIEPIETVDVHEALFMLQGILRGVKRDAKNDFHKNKYATLEQVTDTIRPHFQALGIYWSQSPGAVVDGCIEVRTNIIHVKSTSSVGFVMMMPLAKRDPQGAGAAITYAMRYSLMAVLGIPPTDDDAETAYDRRNERPEPDGRELPEPPVGDPDDMPTIPKSSAHLKRKNAWDLLKEELEQDMLDVHTLPAFERVRLHYGARAKEEGWNKTFLDLLRDEFAYHRDRVRKEAIKDKVEDTF